MKRNDNWPATAKAPQFRPQNAQIGRIVLPVANLTTDSESETSVSYSRLIVIVALFRLVSEKFACDRQTDGRHRVSLSSTFRRTS